MKDNVEFIQRNPLLTLLPELSESGQGIIYGNSSMIPAGDDVDKVIKLWWYLIHIGCENPMIRKVRMYLYCLQKYTRRYIVI